MKETNLGADHIGQKLIKLTSNLCFSVFVVSVLIFTVTAITYQPPNPWLESAPAFTKLLTQTENATFKIDDSVVKTGEDLQTGTAPAVPPPADIKPITEEVIKKKEEEVPVKKKVTVNFLEIGRNGIAPSRKNYCEFFRDWKKWNRSLKKKVPVKKVVAHKMTPMQPRKVKSTIIWRQFDGQEPENYWHRMCEGRAAKYIQRPWHAV